jgi:hypothetical protein
LLEVLAVGEDVGHGLHRDVLGVELLAKAAVVLFVAYHAAPEVDQYLGDVDLDGTHLVARAAQRRGVGKRVGSGLPNADELGSQDRADRARIDGVVSVPAGSLVDGADVQARRAADAVEGLTADLV